MSTTKKSPTAIYIVSCVNVDETQDQRVEAFQNKADAIKFIEKSGGFTIEKGDEAWEIDGYFYVLHKTQVHKPKPAKKAKATPKPKAPKKTTKKATETKTPTKAKSKNVFKCNVCEKTKSLVDGEGEEYNYAECGTCRKKVCADKNCVVYPPRGDFPSEMGYRCKKCYENIDSSPKIKAKTTKKPKTKKVANEIFTSKNLEDYIPGWEKMKAINIDLTWQPGLKSLDVDILTRDAKRKERRTGEYEGMQETIRHHAGEIIENSRKLDPRVSLFLNASTMFSEELLSKLKYKETNDNEDSVLKISIHSGIKTEWSR